MSTKKKRLTEAQRLRERAERIELRKLAIEIGPVQTAMVTVPKRIPITIEITRTDALNCMRGLKHIGEQNGIVPSAERSFFELEPVFSAILRAWTVRAAEQEGSTKA
jgi:hypothetical protein